MSFRNRCVILGANGPITLSVPVQGGRNEIAPMRELRISNTEKWQVRHWRTLQSAYSRSPFFDYLAPGLERLFQGRFEWLMDWNLACFTWINDNLAKPISWSVVSEQSSTAVGGGTDLRNTYLPGKLAREGTPSPYPQVFSDRFGFVPNLSVLDCLFCAGPTLNNSTAR